MTAPSATRTAAGWKLECSYANLPESFYTRLRPEPVREPELIVFNRPLAASLGLDADTLDSEAGAAIFAGNALPEGSEPIAQAYAGHQFGHFTSLGDGRAHLLGEQIAPDGARMDVQLKGSGRTPYSRNGDGRATLGPMLREYIISAAMGALGIPTTRSLAVTATGEPVYREQELPGAVLTRIAASHIRVGTFQWAAAQQDEELLRVLADYTLQRHYPDLADTGHPYLAMLEAISERQAGLIARWLLVGFVHGVMNTDNMALSGETIDYGPCAFVDAYDPTIAFSSIDRHGRYAYRAQPSIGLWNLTRFAETLLPLLDEDEQKAIELAKAVLSRFENHYQRHWLDGMKDKLGLFSDEDDDTALAFQLMDWMQEQSTDFTNTFRSLSAEQAQPAPPFSTGDFPQWHARWKQRLSRQPQTPAEVAERMQSSNPAVIPRNHKVEEALAAAVNDNDLRPMRALLDVLSTPYDHKANKDGYTEPAPPDVGPYRTFCGT